MGRPITAPVPRWDGGRGTVADQVCHLANPRLRAQVREALGHQLGLDLRPELDGAAGGALLILPDQAP